MPSSSLPKPANDAGDSPCVAQHGRLALRGRALRREGLAAEHRPGGDRLARVEARLLRGHVLRHEQAAERPLRHHVAGAARVRNRPSRHAAGEVVVEQRRLRRREGELGTGTAGMRRGALPAQALQAEIDRLAVAAEALRAVEVRQPLRADAVEDRRRRRRARGRRRG